MVLCCRKVDFVVCPSFYLQQLSALVKMYVHPDLDFRALTLASPEVRFHIDSETHDPVDLQTKELK